MPRRKIPNPLGQAIGQRIRQLRREQGVTAEKLAYESEVGSKGYLSDIEHGLAVPSLVTLERIAQRLEVSLFDLLVRPGVTERERVVDATRKLSSAQLAQLLRDISEMQPHSVPVVPVKWRSIRSYPSLEVAAGWTSEATARVEPAVESLRLPGPFDARRDFAVRASGDSMHGFRNSIRDGDWLVMRRANLSPEAAMGQVVLVLREDRYGDKSLHLKRIAQQGRKLYFRSDDPAVAAIAATEHDTILAQLVRVVAPEALVPPPHTRLPIARFGDYFGFSTCPTAPSSRIDGHLFFVLRPREYRPKAALPIADFVPRPAELAFVIVRDADALEYCGIAQFDPSRQQWRMRSPAKSD